MIRFCLLPIETTPHGEGTARGPKYFQWSYDPDPPPLITNKWSMMDYGFLPTALLVSDLTTEQHDLLAANADVYIFPENLDAPVSDPTIDTFFEGINIPTDWLTPATTYRELLRQLAGMFQFNQRYRGIVFQLTGEIHSVFENATLDTRLRQMTPQEEEWFYLTVESFGFPRAIVNRNSFLRQLIKAAGDFWAGTPFYLGGMEF